TDRLRPWCARRDRFDHIGFMKALRRWNAEIPGLLIANGLSLMTATSIGGFTLADGDNPVFAEAFARYFLPQLTLYRYNRRKRVEAPRPGTVA
ncbi:MAG TPA: hypothetical protein VKB15_01420, partial [Xanthobacteraceae bacterium]|nr:hypothetical protein [Xanthobacteraceae bacterium]